MWYGRRTRGNIKNTIWFWTDWINCWSFMTKRDFTSKFHVVKYLNKTPRYFSWPDLKVSIIIIHWTRSIDYFYRLTRCFNFERFINCNQLGFVKIILYINVLIYVLIYLKHTLFVNRIIFFSGIYFYRR